MPLGKSFVEQNRASANRIRALSARLTDEEMQHPVDEHWTVAIALVHFQTFFWLWVFSAPNIVHAHPTVSNANRWVAPSMSPRLAYNHQLGKR